MKDRFWSFVNKTKTCWLWLGAKNDRGYGQYCPGYVRVIYAHRYVWSKRNGSIPDGYYICHRCDVPNCVRPSHLFLGTPKENFEDMRRKGAYNPRHPNRIKAITKHGRYATKASY